MIDGRQLHVLRVALLQQFDLNGRHKTTSGSMRHTCLLWRGDEFVKKQIGDLGSDARAVETLNCGNDLDRKIKGT